jgi:hypothetical protein
VTSEELRKLDKLSEELGGKLSDPWLVQVNHVNHKWLVKQFTKSQVGKMKLVKRLMKSQVGKMAYW